MDRLPPELLEPLIDARDVGALSYTELRELFEAELAGTGGLPDGVFRLDPRNEDRVVYNRARARRPHDNRPREAQPPCIVCSGQITRAVDVTPLSEGFSLINKNLYPVLYPSAPAHVPPERRSLGLHFLQWTSSLHDRDWHNMPRADCVLVLQRLAALERTLLRSAADELPDSRHGPWGGDPDHAGYFCLMKNHGHLVGGSIEHGHQQLAFSSVMPGRLLSDLRFEQRQGCKYAAWVLEQVPPALVLRDYGPALLLVPPFMRRPYDMQLVLRDPDPRHLHQLSGDELAAVAMGWADATRAILHVMPAIGRPTAYNVTAHSGPGAGVYFEFLPYTQETGGFEHLGLILCQADPGQAARELREAIDAV